MIALDEGGRRTLYASPERFVDVSIDAVFGCSTRGYFKEIG